MSSDARQHKHGGRRTQTVRQVWARCFAAAMLLLPATPSAAQAPATPPLTLAQVQAAALATNPAAQAAAQQFAQAQARLGQAQAQKRFQLTFSSTVSGSDASVLQPPPSQETFGTLQNTLTVPLPVGRRPGLVVKQAERQVDAARFQFQAARIALAGQAAAAYYDLLRKQALRAVAQAQLELAQQGLIDTSKRFRAGDAAELDVLQAQVPVANAEAALAQAAAAAAGSQQVLNDLLGRPLDAPVTLADVTTVPPAPPLSLDGARARALQLSPDVQAADANVQAAEAAVQSARLFREPTYSVQAIDIRSNDQTSFSREDTVQAQVSLPLTDGGLGQAQTREADAALLGARAQALVARKSVLLAVSAAFLSAGSSRAQVAAALAAQEIARTTYDKTVQGYENGLFPFINVLTAQNALTQARIALVQARYDAASAASTLQAAVAGGLATGTGGVNLSLPAPPNGNTPPGTNASGTSPAGTNANGTSPAGAGTPGTTTPSGTSTTAPSTMGGTTP